MSSNLSTISLVEGEDKKKEKRVESELVARARPSAHPIHHGDHIHRLSLWNLSGTLPSLSNAPARSAHDSRTCTSTLYSALFAAATWLPAVCAPASQAPQSTARPTHRSRHPHDIPTNRVRASPKVDRVAIEEVTVRVHRASGAAEIGTRGGCVYVSL